MYFGAAAIVAGTQQRVRCRNPNLVRATCGSMEDVCLSSRLTEQQIQTLACKFSERKAKTYVKFNSSLSLDFSVQLNVSLSERLSSWLSKKVKSPTVSICMSVHSHNSEKCVQASPNFLYFLLVAEFSLFLVTMHVVCFQFCGRRHVFT